MTKLKSYLACGAIFTAMLIGASDNPAHAARWGDSKPYEIGVSTAFIRLCAGFDFPVEMIESVESAFTRLEGDKRLHAGYTAFERVFNQDGLDYACSDFLPLLYLPDL